MSRRYRHPQYGIWGKHLELFEMAQAFLTDPRVQERFEAEGLREGTGAPEGRADFPIFLQTVIRHVMRERFRGVAAKWNQYMGLASAQDFREHTTSELGAIRGIQPVQEDGEYKRLRSREAPGPSFAVAKHGGIYSVTMELVINDDTDQILNRIPAEIGRSAAEYMAQVFVAFIESNPTYFDGSPFFGVSRGNEIVGSDADLTEDNLLGALELMKLRRDIDNVPFTVQPSKILVRGLRQAAAIERMRTSEVTAIRQDVGTNPGTFAFRGTANTVRDIIPPPLDEPWFNDPNDAIILGDVQDRPAFRAAFLRGNQEPFIGQKESGVISVGGGGRDLYQLEFDHIPFKVRQIFGAQANEPLAALRLRPS